MPKSLSLPKQYRGSGDLRSVVDRNTRALLTHINNTLIAREEDGTVNMFAISRVVLPSVDSKGSELGFFGATPVAKPVITGSRGGNAALQSLLTALDSLGLVSNTSTA